MPRDVIGVQFRSAALEVSDDSKREVTFIASDESTDRYGDIIRVDGWELSNFKNNPVLLFGHESRKPPVGRVAASVEGKALIARATFMPDGMYAFADTIWKMVREKFLRAVSVGFLPTKAPNDIKDPKTNEWTGYEWVGQELLELSVVPIPANPAALQLAREFGATRGDLSRLFYASHSALAFHEAKRHELETLRLGAASHFR